MKKHIIGRNVPIWLLALLLILSLTLGATAEAGTIFPWLTYTLDVALATADPELVDFKDTPNGGVMVMVKLVSLSGTIQTTDIKEKSLEISLRDGNGNEYEADTWRVRGLENTEGGGFPKIKEEQDGFELLFFLKGKDESAIDGAKLVVPDSVEGQRVIVSLDKAPHEVATSAPTEEGAQSAASFLLGGVHYTLSASEDEPKLQLPNRMDGKEGHVVAFSYPGHGSDAKDANKLLYSGARLRQPNGDVVKPYSNGDNIGNPYELYFGLSDDVLLADCVFTITGDEGDVEIPLSDISGDETSAVDEPQTTPAVTNTPETTPAPTEEPTPEPTEEPEAERDANTFAYTVGGETYELALVGVAYDKEEKAMAVEIVLYDHELLDFIWDKELHMPFGCGIISQKDGFAYVEGVTATVSTPMHMTFHFDTKTLPDLICFGKLNEEEYTASEDFALVDPENNQFISTFPLSALLENEKEPDEILKSSQAEETTPTAPATEELTLPSDENASEIERKILAVLAQCAQDTSDEWQLAIYNAGVREVSADPEKEGVYTFKLRSFDPGLKALGKFSADNQETYLSNLLGNVQTYGLEATLTVENGEVNAKSIKALQGIVQEAAAASQKAFKDKNVLSAIAYDLFYDSFGSKVKKADDIVMATDDLVMWQVQRYDRLERLSAQQWTAFLYGQTKQTLDVSGGPFAIKLNCTSIDYAQLIENAKADAFNALKYLDYDNRWEGDQLEYQYILALADNAITMKKSGKEAYTISLNLDGAPIYDEEYTERLAMYPYEEGLETLKDMVSELPEYAAKEFPSTGWLSGSKSGTQVRIKAPKDSDAYYVQMKNYHNDELVASGFVQPGKTCTLRVPKGDYYFVMACGSTWYGEKHLFGDDTDISKTGLMEVKSSNYYHTVTLRVTEGGNMPIYGADENDLK